MWETKILYNLYAQIFLIIDNCCEMISLMEDFNEIRWSLYVDPLNSYF